MLPSAACTIGQVPSAYKALKMELAVDREAKDVPTTVMRPVPTYIFLVNGILNLVICRADRNPEQIKEAATMSEMRSACQIAKLEA